MNIRGFNIYEYFINKFIDTCNPKETFKLIFLAISPPLPKTECKDKDNTYHKRSYDDVYCYYKYFYNYRCDDSLRDYVFAQVFLEAKLNGDYKVKESREFLCKLTRCGIVLLDLAYFPTTQSMLNRILAEEESEEGGMEKAIVSYTVNNILELGSHDTHVIILYNKDNRMRLVEVLNKIKEQIKPHVKQIHEIQDFFSRRYSKEHVEIIIGKIKEALGNDGYKEIVKCVKGSVGKSYC